VTWQPGDPLYAPNEAIYLCPRCHYPAHELLGEPVVQCPSCGRYAQRGDTEATYRAYYSRHIFQAGGQKKITPDEYATYIKIFASGNMCALPDAGMPEVIE